MCDRKTRLRNLLLEFLEESEIRRKIFSIVRQNGAPEEMSGSADRKELEKLSKSLIEKEKEAAGLRQRLAEAAGQIESLKKELASSQKSEVALKQRIEKLSGVGNAMDDFQRIYDLYLHLPEQVRSSLSGTFCSKNLRSFIFCGVQADRLLEFRDFCLTDFKRGKNLEVRESLIQIFDFFFKIINEEINENPLYLRMDTKVGEKFNDSVHTCTSSSDAVGIVDEVLLPGIVYAATRKIFKKSLVSVKR